MMPSGSRRGVVLLEAIVALVIITIGGLTLAAAVRQSVDVVYRAQAADDDARRASNFFNAIALWTREDLDRHLGSRGEGPWRLAIDRPTPVLYVIALRDSSGHHTLLRTVLYRPETAHAP